MSEKCPNCGKEFAVLWPSQWAYVNGKGFFCSWKCLRACERKEEETMDKQRNDQLAVARELVEVLKRGEDPDAFLASKGYTNTKKAYQNIKAMVYRKDPELYEQFPRKSGYKKKPVETPERNFGGLCPPPENAEIPEKPEPKKRGPIVTNGLTIRALEGKYGTYLYKPKIGYLDYESHDYSGIVSMKLSDWRMFLAELKVVANGLGVDL